ncbi:hypothetical protein GMO_16180 [Gluconobacter morbifer G707]|uniref:Uncharacterized protein n=1 Tax=Gluconobacter morbifer G707 TaxID=1088869 RepID=G6XJN9_9PROT|nr:hypothetical protein GMO_16180 [Gluconobacter morbifer G707]
MYLFSIMRSGLFPLTDRAALLSSLEGQPGSGGKPDGHRLRGICNSPR